MIQREEDAKLQTVSSRVPGALKSNLSEQEMPREHVGQSSESIVAGGAESDGTRAEIPTPAPNSSINRCAPSAHRDHCHMVVKNETQGRGCVKPRANRQQRECLA